MLYISVLNNLFEILLSGLQLVHTDTDLRVLYIRIIQSPIISIYTRQFSRARYHTIRNWIALYRGACKVIRSAFLADFSYLFVQISVVHKTRRSRIKILLGY